MAAKATLGLTCLHPSPLPCLATGGRGRLAGDMLEIGSNYRGYEILEFLGAGGAGSVYRALQEGLDREVALKVVGSVDRPGSEHRKRFMREARALARLSHPHIVRIYDFGEDGSALYYSMEYAPALSLDKKLQEAVLFKDEALEILRQILDALETVHDLGVLHRDIKPANVLIQPSGNVLLSDFGLAREEEATRMTREGVMLGTLPYFPPEMASNEDVDARGDLYQVGIMLYDCLIGAPPYSSQEILTMLKGGSVDPERALGKLHPEFDSTLIGFLRKAIQPDPARRFQSAREMHTALGRMQTTAAIDSSMPTALSTPALEPPPPLPPPRRKKVKDPQNSVSTLTLQVLGMAEQRYRPLVIVIAAAFWILAIGAGIHIYRQMGSSDQPVVKVAQVQETTPVDDSAPIPKARLQAREKLKELLLAERSFPLYPGVDLGDGNFVMEAVVVAAGEIEHCGIIWESTAGAPRLRKVNDSTAGPDWDNSGAGRLINGNNSFQFSGGTGPMSRQRGVVEIRRRQGADLKLPPPRKRSDGASDTSVVVRRLMVQAIKDWKAGRHTEALASCQRAADMDPESWEAIWRKGMALHYIGWVSRGLKAAGGGLMFLSPTDEDPEKLRQQQFQCFNQALAMMPPEGNIWYDLGTVYRDLDRPADSRRARSFACVLDTKDPRYWWELTRSLRDAVPSTADRQAERLDLALMTARAAFAGEESPDPDWLSERGALFQRAGLRQESIADYERVLLLEPGNKRALKALGR